MFCSPLRGRKQTANETARNSLSSPPLASLPTTRSSGSLSFSFSFSVSRVRSTLCGEPRTPSVRSLSLSRPSRSFPRFRSSVSLLLVPAPKTWFLQAEEDCNRQVIPSRVMGQALFSWVILVGSFSFGVLERDVERRSSEFSSVARLQKRTYTSSETSRALRRGSEPLSRAVSLSCWLYNPGRETLRTR